MLSLDSYITFFNCQSKISLNGNASDFFIEKDEIGPIIYFNKRTLILKVSNGNQLYALKCNHTKKTNQLENEVLLSKQTELKTIQGFFRIFIPNINGDTVLEDVIVANWLDEFSYLGGNIRYIKEIHELDSKNIYLKRRRKVKLNVLAYLSVFFFSLFIIKFFNPNGIFVNPIDYQQLVLDDSLRTSNMFSNKNVVLVPDNEVKILKKPINTPTITDLTDVYKIEEEIKSNLENTKKATLIKLENKNRKKIAAIKSKKDTMDIKKRKIKEEKAIKIINNKSSVTFRSTDF